MDQTGLHIPGYTIIKRIGRGGCADVYLAVQESLNRRVALKLLKNTLTTDTDFQQRFNREGRIVAQLSHPNIVSIFDIGIHDDHYYMAMEYLPEGDLKQRMRELTLGETITIIKQMTDALDVAHTQGFVHRDIKPSNILFREKGEAVLADFGIARKTESLTNMTMTGAFLGTPAYMSPEQIDGGELDGRSDLYSLGVTLFECLTGYQPYRSDSALNVAIQHLNTSIPQLPSPSTIFQPLINSLLSKDPSERIPSTQALEEALQKIKLSSEQLEQPLTAFWPEQVPEVENKTQVFNKPNKKTPYRTIISATLLIILSMSAIGFWFVNKDKPEQIVFQPETTLSPEALQISNLMAQGNELRIREKLHEPDQPNALTIYREVLAIDPDHAEAQQGEQSILRQLALEVDELIYAKDIKLAENKIATLQMLWPDSERTLQLQEKLKTEQQKQQQQKLEQARGIERKKEQQKIAKTLDLAERAMADKRYVRPTSNNVLYYLQQTARLAPEHPSLPNRLDRLLNTLLTETQAAIINQQFTQAKELLKDARSVDSNYPKINTTENQLNIAIATRQKEQEQALQKQALEKQISTLKQKTERWNDSDDDLKTLSKNGQELLTEIEQLLNKNPESTSLEDLQNTIQYRLQNIKRQQRKEKNIQRTPSLGF